VGAVNWLTGNVAVELVVAVSPGVSLAWRASRDTARG